MKKGQKRDVLTDVFLWNWSYSNKQKKVQGVSARKEQRAVDCAIDRLGSLAKKRRRRRKSSSRPDQTRPPHPFPTKNPRSQEHDAMNDLIRQMPDPFRAPLPASRPRQSSHRIAIIQRV